MLNCIPTLGGLQGLICTTLVPNSGSRYLNNGTDNVGMEPELIVRANLKRLLEAARDGHVAGPATVLDLEAASGVGKSTIYRILSPEPENAAGIALLQRIAEAYNLHAWQLLVPHFDPLDPPAILSPKEREEIAIMRVVFNHVKSVASGNAPSDIPRSGSNGNGPAGAGPYPGPKPKKHKHP